MYIRKIGGIVFAIFLTLMPAFFHAAKASTSVDDCIKKADTHKAIWQLAAVSGVSTSSTAIWKGELSDDDYNTMIVWAKLNSSDTADIPFDILKEQFKKEVQEAMTTKEECPVLKDGWGLE